MNFSLLSATQLPLDPYGLPTDLPPAGNVLAAFLYTHRPSLEGIDVQNPYASRIPGWDFWATVHDLIQLCEREVLSPSKPGAEDFYPIQLRFEECAKAGDTMAPFFLEWMCDNKKGCWTPREDTPDFYEQHQRRPIDPIVIHVNTERFPSARSFVLLGIKAMGVYLEEIKPKAPIIKVCYVHQKNRKQQPCTVEPIYGRVRKELLLTEALSTISVARLFEKVDSHASFNALKSAAEIPNIYAIRMLYEFLFDKHENLKVSFEKLGISQQELVSCADLVKRQLHAIKTGGIEAMFSEIMIPKKTFSIPDEEVKARHHFYWLVQGGIHDPPHYGFWMWMIAAGLEKNQEFDNLFGAGTWDKIRRDRGKWLHYGTLHNIESAWIHYQRTQDPRILLYIMQCTPCGADEQIREAKNHACVEYLKICENEEKWADVIAVESYIEDIKNPVCKFRAMNLLGVAYLRQGNRKKALELFEQNHTSLPTNLPQSILREHLYNLGYAYSHTSRHVQNALDFYERAGVLGDPDAMHGFLADALLHKIESWPYIFRMMQYLDCIANQHLDDFSDEEKLFFAYAGYTLDMARIPHSFIRPLTIDPESEEKLIQHERGGNMHDFILYTTLYKLKSWPHVERSLQYLDFIDRTQVAHTLRARSLICCLRSFLSAEHILRRNELKAQAPQAYAGCHSPHHLAIQSAPVAQAEESTPDSGQEDESSSDSEQENDAPLQNLPFQGKLDKLQAKILTMHQGRFRGRDLLRIINELRKFIDVPVGSNHGSRRRIGTDTAPKPFHQHHNRDRQSTAAVNELQEYFSGLIARMTTPNAT